jgi:excisionase family DNA binding protein
VCDSTASPTVGGVYTMAEAARLKGVSYHTVSRAVRTGKLPVQRIGRMAMITAEDLEAWQPMVERRTSRHRYRAPDPSATPVLMDPVVGEWAEMMRRVSALEETVAALTSEVAELRAARAHDAR